MIVVKLRVSCVQIALMKQVVEGMVEYKEVIGLIGKFEIRRKNPNRNPQNGNHISR